MPDERSEDDRDPADNAARQFEDFGDYARFQAASRASLAETLDQGRRQISEVFNRLARPSTGDDKAIQVPPLDDLLTGIDKGAQRMKLLSSLSAAQAVAWDHMQAHGGPEDPVAYADYGAATEFHVALIANAPVAEKNEDGDAATGE